MCSTLAKPAYEAGNIPGSAPEIKQFLAVSDWRSPEIGIR
jgi:hypothetical protein